jgi:diguanylate cyclase (GGDEF)-like protein
MSRNPYNLQNSKEKKFISLKVGISFLQTLFSFFVPGGVLVLAISFVLPRGLPTITLPLLVRIYPYVVLAAGIWFGWHFNRSRLIFVIVALALTDRLLLIFAEGSGASVGAGRVVYNAVCILLPLNLVVFSLVKERGFISWRGKWPLGMILFQIIAVTVIGAWKQLGLSPYLEYSFVKIPLFNLTPMAQPGLLAFGAAFFILLFRYVQHRSSMECAFFWALVSSFFALALGDIGPISTIFFSTAVLVLVISVIETSFNLSFYDDLTGLPARRALKETLSKIGRHFTVAMIEVDSFKKINDRYGLVVGDQVLRMVATKLEKVTGGGLCYRYSEQRFAVVFPVKFVDETIPHLESLRKNVEIYSFILRGPKRPREKPANPEKYRGAQKRISLTIAIGVVERIDAKVKPKYVINSADQALLNAQSKGGNQIACPTLEPSQIKNE